jgi:hypothetical protein
LALLDDLMSLPLAEPVPRAALSAAALERLDDAPAGVVQSDGEHVTRLVTPPLTVVAVTVRGSAWRPALRRSGVFAPFAQRILLLDRRRAVPSALAWEASVSGVGVWLGPTPSTASVQISPEPFRPRYLKPAGWRFAERAWQVMQGVARPLRDAGELVDLFPGDPGNTDSAGFGQLLTPPLW